jgi:hypothetical protein
VHGPDWPAPLTNTTGGLLLAFTLLRVAVDGKSSLQVVLADQSFHRQNRKSRQFSALLSWH